MGPLSGIGDSFFWGTFRVIAAGAGFRWRSRAAFLGPILFLLLFNVPHLIIRYYCTIWGYQLARSLFRLRMKNGLIQHMTKLATVIGLTTVGAMIATMVTFNVGFIAQIGETTLVLQEVFDQIMPKILPLLLTLGAFGAIRKGRQGQYGDSGNLYVRFDRNADRSVIIKVNPKRLVPTGPLLQLGKELTTLGNETVSFYSRRILTEQGMVEGAAGRGREVCGSDRKSKSGADRGRPGLCGSADLRGHHRSVHSHGYRSWSAKTIDKAEIQGLSKILPSIGVTATLATTSGWKAHEMEMFSAIAEALDEGVTGGADFRHSHGRAVFQSRQAQRDAAGRSHSAKRGKVRGVLAGGPGKDQVYDAGTGNAGRGGNDSLAAGTRDCRGGRSYPWRMTNKCVRQSGTASRCRSIPATRCARSTGVISALWARRCWIRRSSAKSSAISIILRRGCWKSCSGKA